MTTIIRGAGSPVYGDCDAGLKLRILIPDLPTVCRPPPYAALAATVLATGTIGVLLVEGAPTRAFALLRLLRDLATIGCVVAYLL
jgi:hypothetical protein